MPNIPQIIWSFWHTESKDMPKIYHICLNSWKPMIDDGWIINVLNDETIDQFIDKLNDLPKNFIRLTKTRQSDCIRLALLKKYGGVWMDVGIFLTQSLSRWIHLSQKPFVGFYIQKFQPKDSTKRFN